MYALAALAVVALALLAWWLRGRDYRAAFRVPARRDDTFVCRGEHRTFSVSVTPDGFRLPAGAGAGAGAGGTALLALDVAATARGAFVDPYIEVGSGSSGYRQYFERGATGRRTLNLSPLGPLGDEVRLRGSALRWRADAVLTLFEPPVIEGAEIFVVAPHPDDAEIAAFGVYAGRRAWVVTVTAGERGPADLSGVVPPDADAARWNASLRVWDSLTIPQLGGVPQERCLNLVYPDGQLEGMHRQAPAPVRLACQETLPRATLRSRNAAPEFQAGDAACTWSGLVEELRRLLEKASPDVVLCPHPLIDAHPDHLFATVALEEAARGLAKQPRYGLYVVHTRGQALHPFGPRQGVVSVPPWTDGEWIAESIYSHPLGPELQRTKYFAVEAAHGERVYPSGEPRRARQVYASVKRELLAFVGGTGASPSSFLRRAPRPNELYYFVSAPALSELVKRALARRS